MLYANTDNVGLPYTSGFITGNLSTSGHQGNANMSFSVEIPIGKMRVYIKSIERYREIVSRLH